MCVQAPCDCGSDEQRGHGITFLAGVEAVYWFSDAIGLHIRIAAGATHYAGSFDPPFPLEPSLAIGLAI